MKRTIKHLVLVILWGALSFNAYSQNSEVTRITSSLSTGNSTMLSDLFLNNLDLSVTGNDNVYSKAQATQILRNFFAQNAATRFTIDHEGTSPNGDIYKIGTLSTKKGNYRVTFYLKNESNRYMIKKLQVEKAGDF
jgi:hypothetical protein